MLTISRDDRGHSWACGAHTVVAVPYQTDRQTDRFVEHPPTPKRKGEKLKYQMVSFEKHCTKWLVSGI